MKKPESAFGEWFGMSRSSLVECLRRLADDLENIDQCSEAQRPSAAMNSWTLAKRAVPCLIGRPIGHPTISNGKPAFSSELFYFDADRGVARTMSRWYRLGTKVDADYWNERIGGRT